MADRTSGRRPKLPGFHAEDDQPPGAPEKSRLAYTNLEPEAWHARCAAGRETGRARALEGGRRLEGDLFPAPEGEIRRSAGLQSTDLNIIFMRVGARESHHRPQPSPVFAALKQPNARPIA